MHVLILRILDHGQSTLVRGQVQHPLMHPSIRGPKVELVMRLRPPILGSVSVQEGPERAPITGRRDFQAHPFENSGHDINGLGESVYNPATAGSGFWRRITDYQRN